MGFKTINSKTLIFIFAFSTISTSAFSQQMKCRILSYSSCAPDECTSVRPSKAQKESDISLNDGSKTLKFCRDGKCVSAQFIKNDFGKGIALYSGKIAWLGYVPAPGDKTGNPLGEVRLILDTVKHDFFWRVPYIGTSAEQEEEDVLSGECG